MYYIPEPCFHFFSLLFVSPQGSLKSGLPSVDPASSPKDNDVVRELKMLCEQAATLKAEREVMEVEIKDAIFDISK